MAKVVCSVHTPWVHFLIQLNQLTIKEIEFFYLHFLKNSLNVFLKCYTITY